ncbi:MAG: phosphoesterase [Flavobacteriaceae bacterium]|nr:MAG: phosphoesterase [Flavobacteriaceae bacterium]
MKKIILLFLIVSNSIFAQDIPENKSQTTWQYLKYDVGNMFKGMGYAYTRPLHWQGKQWLNFGGIVAGTGVLYLFDEESSEFFRNQKPSIPKAIRDYGWNVGSPEKNYMITGAVYFTGLFTKNEKLRRTGVLLVSSASAAGLLQQLTKSAVGRARPVSGRSKNQFFPFKDDRDFHSFPSGHTMLAFTNAYAIAKQFKNPWVKAGIYTVGLVPGISRVWEGQHWLSDVAFGVAISIFTVESIDRYLDRKYEQKYNDQAKKISWNLNFSPRQVGIVGRF